MDREDERGRSPYQVIADDLREQILAGHLKGGDRVPSVPRLAEEYGVATATVQSALKVLKTLGLVEGRPGSGTFVRDQLVNQEDGPGGGQGLSVSREDLYELLRAARNEWDETLSDDQNIQQLTDVWEVRFHPLPQFRVRTKRPESDA